MRILGRNRWKTHLRNDCKVLLCWDDSGNTLFLLMYEHALSFFDLKLIFSLSILLRILRLFFYVWLSIRYHMIPVLASLGSKNQNGMIHSTILPGQLERGT